MTIRRGPRLRGSALIMSVTVSLLVGMVTASLLLAVHLATVRAARYLDKVRVLDNARSAAQFALIDLPFEGGERTMSLFNGPDDSVMVVRTPFGLLDLVHVRAWRHGQQARLMAYGAGALEPRTILHLGRQSGVLHLCGDARLRGTVSVPGGEVRRGTVSGRPFSGGRLVEGEILSPAQEIPSLAPEMTMHLARLCSGNPTVSVPALPDNGPWPQVPVITLTGTTRLTDRTLYGPIIIRSDDTLTIDASSLLDMAVVQAPYINIEAGFKGRLQCFAQRGIKVGTGCRLHYPSMLAVVRDGHHVHAPRLEIGEGTWLQGGALLVDRHVRGRSSGGLFIAPRAVVDGEVYADGALELQGEVRGTVRANHCVLRTNSAVHNDHVLDGLITSYPHPFAWCIGLTTPIDERTIVAWQHTPFP